MRIEGAIHPSRGAIGFTREAWCRLVATRPEFRRPAGRKGRNPVDGSVVMFQPTADVAEVIFGGETVGHVYWSMSEEPLVNVSIEPSAVSMVQEWAAALGGEFHSR